LQPEVSGSFTVRTEGTVPEVARHVISPAPSAPATVQSIYAPEFTAYSAGDVVRVGVLQ